MKGTEFFERVYGCMMGGAVGDAMGFATEGFHYRYIRERFAKVTEPLVRARPGEVLHPLVTGCCYTDDTVMKHMVCRAIFQRGGHPRIEELAAVWRATIKDPTEWTWWNNTRVVHAKLIYNPLLPLQHVGRDSIPCNDAPMIIAPVGILNAGDPDAAAADAWRIMPMIQNGYSVECAAAMAAAYAVALSPGATIETVVETARRESPTLRPYVDKALNLVAECGDADEFTERYYAEQLHFPNEHFWTGMGAPPNWSFGADPLETCTLTLALLVLSKGNARDSILAAINLGRDCDTSAGMSAAFCCALGGTPTLPGEWVARIKQDNPEPDIAEYSLRLCELALALRDRQDAVGNGVRQLIGEKAR